MTITIFRISGFPVSLGTLVKPPHLFDEFVLLLLQTLLVAAQTPHVQPAQLLLFVRNRLRLQVNLNLLFPQSQVVIQVTFLKLQIEKKGISLGTYVNCT